MQALQSPELERGICLQHCHLLRLPRILRGRGESLLVFGLVDGSDNQ
jgi:hypothetical protein